jgi:tetratricopeptide (TPR) repeat protein
MRPVGDSCPWSVALPSIDKTTEQRLRSYERSHPELREHMRVLCAAIELEPALALQKLRYICEWLLHQLADKCGVVLPKKPTLETMKGPLRSEASLPGHIVLHVDTIQAYCNFGAHYRKETPQLSHVTPALSALLGLLEWQFPLPSEALLGDVEALEPSEEETWLIVAFGESTPVRITESALIFRLSNELEEDHLVGRSQESLEPWIENSWLVDAVADRLWAAGKKSHATEFLSRCTDAAESSGSHKDVLARLLKAAQVSYADGEFESTEFALRRALEVWEESLDPQPLVAFQILTDLANLLSRSGRVRDVEEFARRAVEIAHNFDELTQALSKATLAEALGSLGRHEEALALATKSCEVIVEFLGHSDPLALSSLHHRARVLLDLGRLDEAQASFADVLAWKETALGPDDIATLVTLDNLGVVERMRGNLDEAEKISRRALSSYESVVGPDSHDRLVAMHNLANVLSKKGALADAEKLYVQELKLSEQLSGPANPETLTSAETLAMFLLEQGRSSEAEPLLERAVAGRKKLLGKEHPKTIESLANLAILKMCTGDPNAEVFLRQILDPVRTLENPIAVVAILGNLAVACSREGDSNEAEQLLTEAIEIGTRMKVPEHVLLPVRFNLCMVIGEDDSPRAMKLRRSTLSTAQRLLGDEDPRTTALREDVSRAVRRRASQEKTRQQGDKKKKAREARRRSKNARKGK